MNIFKIKMIVIFLCLIFITGTPSSVLSAAKKETPSALKSGSVNKKPISTTVKTRFDLSVERIYLNQRCEVIVELKNRGISTIPESVFNRINMNIGSGALLINKKLTVYDKSMRLRLPGQKFNLKTGVVIKKNRSFSAVLDKDNALKETREDNNRKVTKLVPGCKSGMGLRVNKPGAPRTQISNKTRKKNLESGIRILSPASGQQFYAGSSITVRFEMMNPSEALTLTPSRVTGVFLYLDGTKVAELDSSSGLPTIGAKNNQVIINIPGSAPVGDNYTITVSARRSTGDFMHAISDRFSVKHRTSSVSVLSRVMDRTRDEGITITSPRPAQRYMPGQIIRVRFSVSTDFNHWSPETRPTAFRIMLSSDSSTPVTLHEGSETALYLLIPEGTESGDSYKIIVQGLEDPSWYGVAGNFSIGLGSDGLFRGELPAAATAPFLTITEPSDLIYWYAGCTQQVKLITNSTLTHVNLNLINSMPGRDFVLQSDTYSAGAPTTVNGMNQYTIFYRIPSDQGDNARAGHYKLGVEQLGGDELEAISENIWLHRSDYRITLPAGGNYWRNLTVEWEVTGCAAESFDIQLVNMDPDNPAVTEIATGLSARYDSAVDSDRRLFHQSFNWTIPEDFPRGTYKTRLIVYERDVSEATVYDGHTFPIIER